MPSNSPPSKNPSPLSISENRSQDCEEPPTDLSKFNMKPSLNSSNNNNKNNNNNDSNNNSKNNSQQFCLRWNNYQTNLTCVFDQLLQSESFVDVTLACDGNQIKAHKIVLSACSPYFQSLFFDNPCQHPIIIMRDVKWPELKAIVEFMYKGEINVNQDQISPLLAIAEMLQIRGLAEVNSETASAGDNLADTQIKPKQSTPTVDLTAKSRSNETSPIPTFDIEEQLQKQQDKADTRKAKITPRDWESMASMDALNTQQQTSQQSSSSKNQRKRRWPSGERSNATNSSPDNNLEASSPLSINQPLLSHHPSPSPNQIPQFHLPTSLDTLALNQLSAMHHSDDMEIKPGIAEMIREEERTKTKSNELNAKLLENSAWLGATPANITAESYQYQLQSMWQKCWNSQNLVQHMRFRERGPLKSWRPETMAEAIFSVLKEGLSLSQAARKYDIPYPTFVLYANRVHNMLGPSMDGGSDLRPKGRGRPQRILLGIWPDEHIKGVIKSVVFRDEKNLKEEQMIYGRQSPFPFQDAQLGYPNGLNAQAAESMSPDLLAAVRQQMCNMVDAANFVAGFNLPPNMSMAPSLGGNLNSNIPNPKVGSPAMGCNQLNKNGGEPSNAILQMPRLGSPALHLPTELSMHGHLSPNDENNDSRKKDKRMRKSIDEDVEDQQQQQKSGLNNNRLSITKMNSPKSKTPSIDALEPAVNLAISGQTLDMSYKSSRNSSDSSSVNGDEITRSFRNVAVNLGFKDSSPIKLEPLADCRE